MSGALHLDNCRSCGYPTAPGERCPECGVEQRPPEGPGALLNSAASKGLILSGVVMLIGPVAMLGAMLAMLVSGQRLDDSVYLVAGVMLLVPAGLLWRFELLPALGLRVVVPTLLLGASCVVCLVGAVWLYADDFWPGEWASTLVALGSAGLTLTLAWEQRWLTRAIATPEETNDGHLSALAAVVWCCSVPAFYYGSGVFNAMRWGGVGPQPGVLVLVLTGVGLLIVALYCLRARIGRSVASVPKRWLGVIALLCLPVLVLFGLLLQALFVGTTDNQSFVTTLFLWLVAGTIPTALLALRARRLWRVASWMPVQQGR